MCTNVVAVIGKGTAFFSRYACGLYDTCPEPRGWWNVSLLCLGRAPTTCQSHQSDQSRVFMIQPKARVCTDWISKIDMDNCSLRWWDFFFLFWRTVTQWLPKGGDPITHQVSQKIITWNQNQRSVKCCTMWAQSSEMALTGTVWSKRLRDNFWGSRFPSNLKEDTWFKCLPHVQHDYFSTTKQRNSVNY